MVISESNPQIDDFVIRVKNDKVGQRLIAYLAEGADAESQYFKHDTDDAAQQMYQAWQDLYSQLTKHLERL